MENIMIYILRDQIAKSRQTKMIVNLFTLSQDYI